MAGKAYLGIDAGTSVVKAAIFDERGRRAGRAGQADPADARAGRGDRRGRAGLRRHPGHARGGGHATPSARPVQTPESIALTGQGDGCWITDERFRPVRPALSWLDGRAERARRRVGPKSGVTAGGVRDQRRGHVPRRPAACLKWLDLNEPQTLDRAATAGYCKDVIFGRLTGERATDPSDASMPFGDGTGIAYSDRVLELTGLDATGAPCWPRSWRRFRSPSCTPRARPCSGCPRAPPSPRGRSTSRPAASASGVAWPGHRGRRADDRRHHPGLPGAPRRAGHLRRPRGIQRVHRQARPVAAGDARDGRHRVAGLGAAHPRYRAQCRRGPAGHQPAGGERPERPALPGHLR